MRDVLRYQAFYLFRRPAETGIFAKTHKGDIDDAIALDFVAEIIEFFPRLTEFLLGFPCFGFLHFDLGAARFNGEFGFFQAFLKKCDTRGAFLILRRRFPCLGKQSFPLPQNLRREIFRTDCDEVLECSARTGFGTVASLPFIPYFLGDGLGTFFPDALFPVWVDKLKLRSKSLLLDGKSE